MRYTIGLLIILQSLLGASEYILPLGNFGSVHYFYDDKTLLHIDRFSSSEEVMYRHSYNYDADGRLISESLIGDLGEVIYPEPGIVKSPYHIEICEYDDQHNLVRHTQDNTVRDYVYNDLNELIAEDSSESYEYDVAGNMIRKGEIYFTYDKDNRLVKASSNDYGITYTYDDLGRRTSKTINGEKESYGYLGINEVIVVDSNQQVKELRVPGLSFHKDMLRPIAIETRDAIYAPIHDVQNNIVKLIDIKTREVISLALPDPFGRGLSKDSPTSWIFSGKNYDKEVDLVYFGHRYYSPELKKWLSYDPACQSLDLHQYCFNNPFTYFDPDGQIAFVIPLIWIGGATLGEVLFDAALVAGAAWLGHEAVKKGNKWSDKEIYRKKEGSIDPALPKDPFKDSRLEDISHPDAKARGHYQFKDKKTGEVLEYDKGKPGEPGHKGHDHYHRPNPNSTGRHDEYLDGTGRPVPGKSEESHLYHPDSIWWK